MAKKLEDRIDEMFDTRVEFARAIDIDPATLSRSLKINNWRADKIQKIVETLEIPVEEIPSYFFEDAVENKTTAEAV